MANLLSSRRVKWVLFRLTGDEEIKADVDRAVARYEERHGNEPNSAFCQKGEKLALALAAKGLEVKPARYCGTLFYYLGYVPKGVSDELEN